MSNSSTNEFTTQVDRPVWDKQRHPYLKNSNALQTVDVWLPQTTAPSSGVWLIYIHGGAWRDPKVDSSSFIQPFFHVLDFESAVLDKIAGCASINYSLSPHPTEPTDPAPVPRPGVEAIPNRSAKHPDHILDVLSALQFLNSKFAIGNRYILAGHSCGATLAFQVVMDRKQWLKTRPEASHLAEVPKPIAVVGLNGLYDLPRLISEPGSTHQHMVTIYEAFVRLAFGDEKSDWAAVSPTSVSDWPAVWPEGKLVVLAQSHQDSLVNYSQTDFMLTCLRHSAGKSIEVEETDATGDHNDLWKEGDRLAAIMVNTLQKLS